MFLLYANVDPSVIEVPWDLRYWILHHFSITGNGVAIVVFVAALLCIVVPYLLGSINPAIILSKEFRHDDVRKHGSGNAGTTNMLRTYGKRLALYTFLLDLCKAALATLLGKFLLGADGGALAGFFVVFGHMFPIYYRFRGGKGVACMAMVMLVVDPLTFLFELAIFLIIVIGTRYVSLASVMSALIYPLILNAFAGPGPYVIMAISAAVFITFMHRENLKRLLENKESKLDLAQFRIRRKKKKAPEEAKQEDRHE
ncbi:MAG: glycerol-3-phosphate 1-O-acyltransferase PlsY [Clostridia bacterium]|nr:glycerol-3-phosphate 1-O-acyltransferase PlsY [Clostridia bacterium]